MKGEIICSRQWWPGCVAGNDWWIVQNFMGFWCFLWILHARNSWGSTVLRDIESIWATVSGKDSWGRAGTPESADRRGIPAHAAVSNIRHLPTFARTPCPWWIAYRAHRPTPYRRGRLRVSRFRCPSFPAWTRWSRPQTLYLKCWARASGGERAAGSCDSCGN